MNPTFTSIMTDVHAILDTTIREQMSGVEDQKEVHFMMEDKKRVKLMVCIVKIGISELFFCPSCVSTQLGQKKTDKFVGPNASKFMKMAISAWPRSFPSPII